MASTTPVVVQTGNSSKRNTLVLIVVVLILAIAIAVWFYFQGKKKGGEDTTINLSSPLTPEGNAPSASDQEIKSLATELHDDMDGINYYHNLAPWNKLATLSDSDFIRLNNEFNTQYQLESEETFKQWVENESTGAWGLGGNVLFASAKKSTLARLKKLNIE